MATDRTRCKCGATTTYMIRVTGLDHGMVYTCDASNSDVRLCPYPKNHNRKTYR